MKHIRTITPAQGKYGGHRLTREDGRIEWICEHGVGHPIGHVTKWVNWMSVHGCDGCCSEPKVPKHFIHVHYKDGSCEQLTW